MFLRADRWFQQDPTSDPIKSSGDFAGVRINIWNRAKVRRFITHSMAGGGSHKLGYQLVLYFVHIVLYFIFLIGHTKHKGQMCVSSWHAVPRCAYVSVLEEYKGPRKPGHILHILHILICLSTSAWLDQCRSAIVYERREHAQLEVLYVIQVSSILGRLPLVSMGATGTTPFAMQREWADFPGAFCDKSANSGHGCRWWYMNSWALGWGTQQ